MKKLVIQALRDIGLDTPNAEAIVAFRLTDPTLIYEYVHAVAEQLRQAREDGDDDRQGWLALPEFEHVRVRPTDTLQQYRRDTDALSARIKSYSYRRVSDERMKRDKAELRERRKLDKQIAAYFATNPDMTMDRAWEMLRKVLHSAARTQKKKAINARWRRT